MFYSDGGEKRVPFGDPKGNTFEQFLDPERAPGKVSKWVPIGRRKHVKTLCFPYVFAVCWCLKGSPKWYQNGAQMEPGIDPKWSHKQAPKGGSKLTPEGDRNAYDNN